MNESASSYNAVARWHGLPDLQGRLFLAIGRICGVVLLGLQTAGGHGGLAGGGHFNRLHQAGARRHTGAADGGMSNKALNWAFGLPIKGARKAVLIALADRADDDGVAFPSINDIAFRSGMTDRAARASLRDLEADGLIVTDHHTGHRSHYRLILDAETPERRSAHLAGDTPEPASAHPGTTFRPPRNQLPGTPERRSAKPSVTPIEPSGDHQREKHDPLQADLLTDRQATSRKQRRTGGPRRVASLFPADWRPDADGIAFATSKGIVNISDEVASCIEWHERKGQPTASFSASWKWWCRNAEKFEKASNGTKPPVGRDRAAPNHRNGKLDWLHEHLQPEADEPVNFDIEGVAE